MPKHVFKFGHPNDKLAVPVSIIVANRESRQQNTRTHYKSSRDKIHKSQQLGVKLNTTLLLIVFLWGMAT